MKNAAAEIPSDLLEQACPAIKYRLYSELLNQPDCTTPMRALQNQILADELVQTVCNWQQPDGWLAWDFHGSKSIETGIRILTEKGLAHDHPVLQAALRALEEYPERLERGLGKVGAILDARGLGGALMIRAGLLARAGVEEQACIKQQIELALTGFQAVSAVHTLNDLVENYKDKLVYQAGLRWPSIYHLRLLAYSYGWRTPENLEMLTESIQRLVNLSPLPGILVRHKSQLIAPASFCMHDFNPDMTSQDDAHWMMWFHRMELLSRLGIAHQVPELGQQVNTLRELLDNGRGNFTKPLAHAYFKNWGAYTGLMLEKDWRDPQRRIYDLTFRCLLILHYYEQYHPDQPKTCPDMTPLTSNQ